MVSVKLWIQRVADHGRPKFAICPLRIMKPGDLFHKVSKKGHKQEVCVMRDVSSIMAKYAYLPCIWRRAYEYTTHFVSICN